MTCPNCGYCPHCGRSNNPPAFPYWRYPYTIPWIQQPFRIGAGDGTTPLPWRAVTTC